ncbi:MAG: nucleotidyl transferase AbiEii/AbiGii toxin family protein [Deltaproteobacteria bacterium]|nr:nucleotidyl transferase AbiEii/AbiGii toxin family protein [Deltaproteobacteria bacterium]
MTKGRSTNLPASIHQRLLNLSMKEGQDFQFLLTRFALERFLYRLSVSPYAKQFILKGAMLFTVWTGKSRRPTRDLDLLGYCENNRETLTALFQQICKVDVEPDGLNFDSGSIQVEEIREDQEYQGQRVRLVANLGKSQIHIQIDIGFGDITTPVAEEVDYPTLLDLPFPRVRAYPKETVISEKLQAMVSLGMPNSRMKDFYDIWMISKQFNFDGLMLVRAIKATFDRRNTVIPTETPIALSDEFAKDQYKATQWKAFLMRNRLEDPGIALPLVVDEFRNFLIPPLIAAATGDVFNQSWSVGGPWLPS